MRIRVVRDVSFLVDFAYIINGLPPKVFDIKIIIIMQTNFYRANHFMRFGCFFKLAKSDVDF